MHNTRRPNVQRLTSQLCSRAQEPASPPLTFYLHFKFLTLFCSLLYSAIMLCYVMCSDRFRFSTFSLSIFAKTPSEL